MLSAFTAFKVMPIMTEDAGGQDELTRLWVVAYRPGR